MRSLLILIGWLLARIAGRREYLVRLEGKLWRSPAPLPSRRRGAALFAQARGVRVHRGGMNDDRLLGDRYDNAPPGDTTLLEISDPGELAALRALLTVRDGHAGHCMCVGGPTLELLGEDATRIALVGLHHCTAIRWSGWVYDAALEDGPALATWLADRGVTGPRKELEDAALEERKQLAAMGRWTAASPPPLSALTRADWERLLEKDDFAPFRDLLAAGLPLEGERIRSLLRWFGHAERRWSDFPTRESWPCELLSSFPREAIFKAIMDPGIRREELEGGARFLTRRGSSPRKQLSNGIAPPFGTALYGWSLESPRAEPDLTIPAAVRTRLLDHCRSNSRPEDLAEAEIVFASNG